MPQSGFTPLITYNTSTASAVPAAANLTQGELAVNVTDKKIYTKNSGGSVVQVGSGLDAVETLTNKTVTLGSNTVSGTTAQFNSALTDNDFATLAGTETLTNKTLANPSYSGTTANGGTVTTIDINGGTIDGTAIGSTTPAAGSFTTLSASGSISLTSAANADLTLTRAAYSNYSMISFNTVAGQSWGIGSRTSGVTPSDSFSIHSSTYGANVISVTNAGAVTIPGTVTSGKLTAKQATEAGAAFGLTAERSTNDSFIAMGYHSTGDSFRVQASYTSTGAYKPMTFWTLDNERMRIGTDGAVTIPGTLSLTGGTFGYGTGAGGSVTQATSKSTAVTLNKPSGQITMNNAALAAGASVVFTSNNTLVTDADGICASLLLGSVADTANYRLEVLGLGTSGGARIAFRLTNVSAGSLSEAAVIKYQIIKGSAS